MDPDFIFSLKYRQSWEPRKINKLEEGVGETTWAARSAPGLTETLNSINVIPWPLCPACPQRLPLRTCCPRRRHRMPCNGSTGTASPPSAASSPTSQVGPAPGEGLFDHAQVELKQTTTVGYSSTATPRGIPKSRSAYKLSFVYKSAAHRQGRP